MAFILHNSFAVINNKYTRPIWPLLLVAFILGQLLFPAHGFALSWEWSSLPNRERIIITLDSNSPWSVNRVGKQALLLNLGHSVTDIKATTPTQGNNDILKTISSAPDGVYLFTNTNEFGYLVSRQTDNQIRIDIFKDPMGARWKGSGKPEPVPPAEATQPAAPQQVQDTQTQNNANANTVQQQDTQSPRTQIDALINAQQQMGNTTPPANSTPQTDQNTVTNPVVPPAAQPATQISQNEHSGYVAPPVQNQTQNQDSGVPFETPLADSLRDIPQAPATNSGTASPGASMQPAAINQTQPSSTQPQVQYRVDPPAQTGNQQQAQSAGGSSVFRHKVNPGGPEDWDKQASQAQEPMQPQNQGTVKPQNEQQYQVQKPVQTQQPLQTQQPVQAQEQAQEPQAETYPVSGEERSSPEYQHQKPESDIPPESVDPNFPQSERELVMRVPGPPGSETTNEPEIQYDEDGNPIEPPIPPAELIAKAETYINGADYQGALDILNELKARNDLTQDEMEDVLYLISDALFGLGSHEDMLAYADRIIAASEEALNSNLKSARVPSMMLRLGYVNLKVNNVQEAEAYFNLLKRNYPGDANIPLIYYYWGDYFFDHKKYQQAADQFQYIVQNYPDSKFVREASVGLAKALYNLGYYDQSFQIVDYIEKRWPRFYMEYPPILSMIGDASFNMGNYEEARSRYWLYYNLLPSGPEAATVLTRLGDIYVTEKNKKAAREVYEEVVNRFPDSEAGIVAMMRLAEEGVYDAPSIGDMYSIFDAHYSELPYQTYTKIINDFPDSELAPLAHLKLATWYLWNKRYNDALTETMTFADKYPEHPLIPKIREVALTAFGMLAADAVHEKEYNRILYAWDNYPILKGDSDFLSPESRLALAYSEWKSQRSSDALETLKPFFRGAKDPTYGEQALGLALTILVDTVQWEQIADLYSKVELWELTPEPQRQLDYAMALAAENTGRYDQAAALWESLRQRADLPPEQKTYMFYFLSRAAERKKDMETAYYLGRDALKGLTEIAEDDPAKADPVKIKELLNMLMTITEGAGRIQEALDWQRQYAQYVQPEDEDYPAMRYRLGQLYRKSGDLARWAVVMQELVDKSPDSLYGRMAASELRSTSLNDEINNFLPSGGGI